jgi:hypothetical protein
MYTSSKTQAMFFFIIWCIKSERCTRCEGKTRERTEKNGSLALGNRELNSLFSLNLNIPQLHLAKRGKSAASNLNHQHKVVKSNHEMKNCYTEQSPE